MATDTELLAVAAEPRLRTMSASMSFKIAGDPEFVLATLSWDRNPSGVVRAFATLERPEGEPRCVEVFTIGIDGVWLNTGTGLTSPRWLQDTAIEQAFGLGLIRPHGAVPGGWVPR